jgi:geranyl-CoA carboxylase beta subunit
MSGASAAGTMEQVARVSAARRGQEVNEEALAKQRAAIVKLFDDQSDAFCSSGECLDQGIIDPRDTRKVLALALDTCWEARHRKLQPNAFGVARI